MVQPYMLRLERSSSSGSGGTARSTIYGDSCSASLMGSAPGSSTSLTAAAAAAVHGSNRSVGLGSGGKAELTVQTTMAHHLVSKLLLQKQPSLDDRAISNVDFFTSEVGKFVRRQGSVEGDKKKYQHSAGRNQTLTPANGAQYASRLERKVKHSMINLFGALTAVEQDDLDSLRVILSKNCFALNVPLEYGLYSYFTVPLTLLDVALMLGRGPAAEMLLQYGATENLELTCIERRRQVVNTVLEASFDRLKVLRDKSNPSKEEEKRIRLLESQISTVKKMKNVVDQQSESLPGPPTNVRAFVSSNSRATVEFVGPPVSGSFIVIKYKVEWSRSTNFECIDGSLEMTNMRKMRIAIDGLEHGSSFSFRIAAASIFGYGKFAVAAPPTLCISSWEDVDKTPNHRIKQMQTIAKLYDHVERHRQSTVWQRVFPQNVEINVKKKKSGIRYLFSASSKFVKNIQRGVYLVSVIYTENKVLCTVDDCLPVLCVDEHTSTVFTEDLHWLMKLSLCWDQVPYLLESISATSVSNASQLRAKLLEAITSMMNALGVRDIGRVHHVPLIFSNGITFIVTVNLVNENQTVQGLAMRWMRMEKLLRKKSSSCPALDYLNRELFTIINFFESSQIPLDTGLYLCYLRLESSLNVIRVTVPENIPSVLPFSLIRQNPHVSCEEWQWLRQLDESATSGTTSPRPSSLQYAFHQQLGRAASVLIHDLNIKLDQVQNHRLFRLQVLQLHSDVSFILIMPKAEDVCHVNPGYGVHEETFSENFKGCTSIPAPVFQMINLFTYQPDFITAYCRLSIFIEHFLMVLQCEQRQCLLENDAKVYADQLEKLNEFQQRLDEIWRASRWISNIASLARDRQVNCAVPLAQIIPPPAFTTLLPSGIGVDDSADIGYHSDQSAEKSTSFKAIAIECNARTRLLESKQYEDNNNNKCDEVIKNEKCVVSNTDANVSANNTEDDFLNAWKGRNQDRRHSEKNIHHESLDAIASLRKSSGALRLNGTSFDLTESKKPVTFNADRPKMDGIAKVDVNNPRHSLLLLTSDSREVTPNRTTSCKSAISYQRQRRPISMYAAPTVAFTSEAKTTTVTATTSSMSAVMSMPSKPLGYMIPTASMLSTVPIDNSTIAITLPDSPSIAVKTSIVRVYVAYECGLENGASVRLKITNETTAQEIVALVVEQIAKVVNSPTNLSIETRRNTVGACSGELSPYTNDFCLVAIVGNNERRIRDSFPLLKLQSPWSTGRLYVRHVNCISAAINCGSEAYV